jgi:hypothetical protein
VTDQRPAWADALTNAFVALKNQRPTPPLGPLLTALAGTAVGDAELVAFIQRADENEPALTQARIALAKWDSQDEYLDQGGPITPARTQERRAAIYARLGLSTEVAQAFTERIEVFEKPSTTISKVFEPWYAAERKLRTSVYWDDYETYLRDVKKWPASSISSLDETTTEVIERLSRPTRPEAKQTKGLVVGYVQSGKTANFTGVVAKGIDAGYRLIIVLTGTIEILRAQTQRRMDMELMGVENILAGQDPTDPAVAKELDYQQDEEWKAKRFVKHGEALNLPGVVEIARVTSHRSDYKRLPQAMTKLKFARKNKQKPLNDDENLFHSGAYVAIIKKNPAPLKKLIQDLKPLKNDLAELPVLIIDDESDQASVDTTNPKKWKKGSPENRKRTTINQLITGILAICPRAQYVGYTATPFANVFVDPDDERDLFPADFVLSLHRPPGYMGVQEFHDVGKRWDDEEKTVASSNEKAHIRSLVGDVDTNPVGRLKELQEALDAWVLSGAIKKYREANSELSYRHHTMLVHESVKRGAHADTAADVRSLWSKAKFNSSEGFARLKQLYNDDFMPVMEARAAGAPIPTSFEELKPYIGTALAAITIDGDPVLIVNSDKEIQAQQKKLDFEADKVWRILVGGTQLSRGFTVEGLTISYFRRKAGQADTLMQAGRWFGFRPGYQDLVRLYIRRDPQDILFDLYEAFEALLMDEEAFRAELSQYAGFDEHGMPMLEPRQIPPLVSQHLPWLKPTARNKMWNAVIANKAPTDIQDLYGLPEKGSEENRKNFDNVVVPLLTHATTEVMLPYELDGKSGQQRARVGLVDAAQFNQLFNQLVWHPEYEANIKAFRFFIKKATSGKMITDWAVVWTWPNTGGRLFGIPELGGDISIVTRKRRGGRIDFVGSDRKHRAAARPIALGEAVAPLGKSATRGVILVSIVPDRKPDDPTKPVGRNELVGLISIAVPTKAVPRSALIQWTVINSAKPDDVVVDQKP